MREDANSRSGLLRGDGRKLTPILLPRCRNTQKPDRCWSRFQRLFKKLFKKKPAAVTEPLSI